MSKPDKREWFDWPHWGLALGSDHRYKPRWYERRAYVMGLRDAARIADHERWIATKIGDEDVRFKFDPHTCRTPTENLKLQTGRWIVRGIHRYVLRFMGLPPDDRSGLE